MARAGTARLFVALELPQGVSEALVHWGRSIASGSGPDARRLRVLAPDSLHLTLSFLGSRPFDEIDALTAALVGRGREVGELAVGAPVWLPPRRPRALAVEIDDPVGELASLQGDVSRALGAVTGEQPRHARFRPHVTVIRSGAPGAPEIGALSPTPALSFVAEEMLLLRSHLEPAGARYEALARFRLDSEAY
jgi:2'-5' RNA ligase